MSHIELKHVHLVVYLIKELNLNFDFPQTGIILKCVSGHGGTSIERTVFQTFPHGFLQTEAILICIPGHVFKI